MYRIKFKAKIWKISEDEHCALSLLRDGDGVKSSEFWYGRGRHKKCYLPKGRARQEDLGIHFVYRELAKSPAHKKFFKENPRCQGGYFPDNKRVRAILRHIEKQIT